jgi:probable HAF family extracellular repeat protein
METNMTKFFRALLAQLVTAKNTARVKHTPCRSACLLTVLLMTGCGDNFQTRGEFIDLGTLGGKNSYAMAVSADGHVVTGNSNTISGDIHAFRWQNGVTTDLGTLGGHLSFVDAVSADGSVVVGMSKTASDDQFHVYHWKDDVMTDLNTLGTLGGEKSYINAVSADGGVMVGSSATASGHRRARQWKDGVMADLGTLGGDGSFAIAVSADGSVVVGASNTASDNQHAYRWENGAMVDLGTLGDDYVNSAAFAVSADGSVVVGTSDANRNGSLHLYRWQSGVMTDLGLLGDADSYDFAISADGDVVVGCGKTADSTGGSIKLGFHWTAATGIQPVSSWLTTSGVTIPANVSSLCATGISADGSVVIGDANDESGRTFSWLVRVPPTSGGSSSQAQSRSR